MDKETPIRRLNENLAGELSAIIRYVTCAAKVTGPYPRDGEGGTGDQTCPRSLTWTD